MSSVTRLQRAAAAAIAGIALLVLPSTSEADVPPYSGLPIIPATPGFPATSENRSVHGWFNSAVVGLAGSPKALQWIQIPITMVPINSSLKAESPNPGSNTPGVVTTRNTFDSQAFLLSPQGSADPYGRSSLIPVRTVVFGSLPIEASLQIVQDRDADGYPIPLRFQPIEEYYITPAGAEVVRTLPTTLSAQISVAVASIAVDGVDLRLRPGCETGPQSTIQAESQVFDAAVDPVLDTRVAADGFQGGTLRGAVDIAPFKGCVTEAGDNVDGILTSMISGGDNPAIVTYGLFACFPGVTDLGGAIPVAPGQNSPDAAGCIEVRDDNAPDPQLETVPRPWPFPLSAPGLVPVNDIPFS